MKPPILDIENIDNDVVYIPLEQLMESLKDRFELPYQTTFSFLPFMRKMNARVEETSCDMTASMIPQIEALEHKISQNSIDISAQKEIAELTSKLLPSMFFEGEYSFISPPFTKDYAYKTPAMEELHRSEKWAVRFDALQMKKSFVSPLQKAAVYLLNTYYGLNISDLFKDVITFRNLETGLERHYKLSVKEDFIHTELQKPLKKLSRKEISDLVNNLDNEEKILKYLPKESFAFSGFGIGIFNDVTELEIQSQIKDATAVAGSHEPSHFLEFLQYQLRNYLGKSSLDVGIVDVHFEEANGANHTLSGYGEFKEMVTTIFDKLDCHIYQKAYCTKEVVIVEDLLNIENPSQAEQGLIDRGYKSIMLIPIVDAEAKVTTIVELGLAHKYGFNQLDVRHLRPIIDLLNVGNDIFIRELNNKITQYIQNQFTSIHPSVEWRFQEIATQHEFRKRGFAPDEETVNEEIVFKDVYPLYGQADIVNSSNIRNEAIRKDLLENLDQLKTVIEQIKREIDFHILDAYLLKIIEVQDELKIEYTSSIESYILDLLGKEVHPLLNQLKEQFGRKPMQLIDNYFDDLDKDLGIIYKHRKDYELSVTKLNGIISNFLVKEDKKMQKKLPHYFEKYKTDGVEYNIYLGQSILQNNKFSKFHLKDFRLWQLINICDITRIVNGLKEELPVTLDTAQLIFVYNAALSIRFRMDEKQFDVDGTYNVRYEILKKRIDKAVLKGTKERLSQAGKVSIVYLLEKDKQEYLEYLNYLVKRGYIKDNIEDLELEKLQGADGLKALRVEVI